MNTHKRIANKGFEEEAVRTTRSTSKHGLTKGQRRIKTVRNRAAKRAEDRAAHKEET